ncbi:MAG: hypothetical protein ABR599_06550 [Gemmatimonadota bacterium]
MKNNRIDLSKPRVLWREPCEYDGTIIRGVLVDDDTVEIEVLRDHTWTTEGAPEIGRLLLASELSPEEKALLPPE